MGFCCDLEVDVNGEETFLLDKKILIPFSSKLSRLFSGLTSKAGTLKVILPDFPGGAEGFELIARFCYNNGRAEISPFNAVLLNCAACFMEMDQVCSGTPSLLHQTEKSLEEINSWTWSLLLVALKQCQDLLPAMNSSCLLQKILVSLVGRLALPSVVSPCTPSSGCSSFQLSSDTRSTDSVKNSWSRTTWWFEDLVFLNADLIDKVVKMMVSQKLDHVTLSRFLFYYQKSRFFIAGPAEKSKTTEVVVTLLSSLDRSSVSCKGLYDILRMALSLKVSKCCKNILESLIGSQLDQATLDNLLVPSPHGKGCIYYVNLVLRLLKSFLGGQFSSTQLKKVAALTDLYIAEVAPDSSLKPTKFVALVAALPDSARDSYDGIYQATDIYLEVHGGLSEEEKMTVCCALNYEKLSPEALRHLARNSKLPSRAAAKAVITSQQTKLKSLLPNTHPLKDFSYSASCYTIEGSKDKKGDLDQILLHVRKIELSTENERLRAHLQGMQWRVIELEKACKGMQTRMEHMMKSRLQARSLPKLCS
ncbi:BTB/POZ domain-containing protein [Vitis vinifera]|uniref:BTB/POZ domain-containing protein n=1 Tax=Vitis vinifera TaxID=29760 RepID=A0A438BU50_VITVI|nr:BTB/POZ domain-containing protein [Vitis vinifera]